MVSNCLGILLECIATGTLNSYSTRVKSVTQTHGRSAKHRVIQRFQWLHVVTAQSRPGRAGDNECDRVRKKKMMAF